MKIITLSGVDGSGKSTQLALLKQSLEAQGRNVAYFHAVEFSLANKLSRALRGKTSFTPGSEPAVTTASWFSLHLRLMFLALDLIRFCLFTWKLRRTHTDMLLSDRYFTDTLINIEYLAQKLSPALRSTITLGLSILSRLIPKPTVAFYLNLSPASIMDRARVPEQGLVYLEAKQALYQKHLTEWKLIPIDASQNREIVASSIQNFLSKV